jgi:hypothetical protein
MKIILFLFVSIFCLVFLSCNKSCCNLNPGTTVPPPSYIEIVDKTGKSLVTSKSDSSKIIISTPDNLRSNIPTQIKSYQDIKNWGLSVDSVALSKYNGLIILDHTMNGSNVANPPVYSFNLSFNGNNLGTIYSNCWSFGNTTPPDIFTFNNLPVKTDSTTMAHGKIRIIQINQ